MAITFIFKLLTFIQFILLKSTKINDNRRQLQISYSESNLNYLFSETQNSTVISQIFYYEKFTYLKSYNKLVYSTLTSSGTFKLASIDLATNFNEVGYTLSPTTITTDTSNFLSIDYCYIDDNKFLLFYFYTQGNDYSYKSTFVEYSGTNIIISPSYSSLNDKFVSKNNQYSAFMISIGIVNSLIKIQYKLVHSLYSCIGNNKVIYILFKTYLK